MAIVNQDLYLEITPGAIPPILNVTEYDENMQVIIHLRQRGQAFEIPSGTTAKVEGTLAGHPFSVYATPSGNTVTFSLTESMTAFAGRAWTKIKLTQNNKPVSTCGFWLDCDRAGVEAETVIGAPGFEEQIKQAVEDYLDESGFVIDDTLSQQGSAADAKATGDALALARDNIASEYDSSMHYQTGAYVIHSGKLYRARAEIAPEAWNEAHWIRDSLAERLWELENAQIETDDTLTIEGAAADAKAVGNELFTFESTSFTNTDSSTASNDGWGFRTIEDGVYEISLKPILSNQTSYNWNLYKTTDGEPAALNKNLSLIDSGTAQTSEFLTVPFDKSCVIQIDSTSLRYQLIDAAENGLFKLVKVGSGKVEQSFDNYVFAGQLIYKKKKRKLEADITLSVNGAFADSASVGAAIFETISDEGTVSYTGSGANIGEWGVFFPDDETIIGLKYKPYWNAESGSCPWKLYRTTDGSNVSLGKSLTPVAGGTVEVGETIELDTFGPQYILSLVTSNSTPRVHCLNSTGTYAKLGGISNNYLASRDYNLAMSGEFELARKVPKWETVVKNHWNGKSWYAYGTSLTSTSQGKYAKYVAQISGLMLNNFGIGGGGLISNRNIYNRLMDNTDGKVNADLITIEIGANDAGSPLGTPLDTDNTTFCGSLNVCLKNILTNCPKAQIVIMDSTRSRTVNSANVDIDEQTSGGFNYLQRAEAIRQVAEINGVYYIPLASGLGMGIYRMQSSDLYNVDSIHHTELGGYNLAQGVWSYLKNIPLWYSEMPEVSV